MASITLDDRIEIEPSAIFQKAGDEIVFLHTRHGVYYGLNAVGSRAWELLVQHRQLRLVFEAMRDEFDVAADVLRDDLLRITAELRDKNLIRVLPAPAE